MSVQFVAEVSSNHNQDLSRCTAFVDRAAGLGCWGVKFQLFRVDKLFAPEILERSSEHRARRAWELPVSFLPEIAARCQQRGIQFGCTPFYLEAVSELLPFVDFFKIASYELLWDDLLRAVAQTGKTVVISTGMANLSELSHVSKVLRENGMQQVTWLHCNSSYPCPIEECNLAAMDRIRDSSANKRDTGWSDHSVNPGIIYAAVFKHDASMIEFHLDLDGTGAEYKIGHCWLPEQIAPVIRAVRDGERAEGDGLKIPKSSERADWDWRRDPSDGLRPMKAVRESFLT